MWVLVLQDKWVDLFPTIVTKARTIEVIDTGLGGSLQLVTWVEHVEVDDRSPIHRLYRDLVCSGQAYGAKRWITTLQRMCERFAYSLGSRATQPSHELDGVSRNYQLAKDEKTRAQWDVLSSGNPVNEIAHVTTGSHPGNCISIMQFELHIF
ncbi:hypothetical protein RJ639_020106 [Escallonia herrerae]|uniref:START domain-containing protein n=1 Tax=Escallonia herrerae TaxID=1293975 RepID=A0AA89AHV7_9ASTE|nr:hypothetical protein RJ639_020106 [Escallonia herrerae]